LKQTINKLASRLVVAALLFTPADLAFGQHAISAEDARSHIGEYAKVCGQVASTRFAYRSRGSPTFINLDQPISGSDFHGCDLD
jgi:hypothetical protein